jgi:hypothetical protein
MSISAHLQDFPFLSPNDFAVQCHVFINYQKELQKKGYGYTAGHWELKMVPAPFVCPLPPGCVCLH